MVRTPPFQGGNTGSSPVRDKSIKLILLDRKSLYYWSIKLRILLFSFFIQYLLIFITVLLYKDEFIYILLGYLIHNYTFSGRLVFDNLSEIFSSIIFLGLWFSFILGSIINYIVFTCFFWDIFSKNTKNHLINATCISFSFVFFFLILEHFFLNPFIFIWFHNYLVDQNFVSAHLDIKFMYLIKEYIILTQFIFLLSQFPLFTYLFYNFANKFNFSFIIQKRFMWWLIFLLLSAIFAFGDFFSQIFLFLMFFGMYEYIILFLFIINRLTRS